MAESNEQLTTLKIEKDIKKILNLGQTEDCPVKQRSHQKDRNTKSNKTNNAGDKKKGMEGKGPPSLKNEVEMVEVINLDKSKNKKKKKQEHNEGKAMQATDVQDVFLHALEKDFIFPLRHKRRKGAKFFCRVCNAHLFTKEDCSLHIGNTDHCMALKRKANPGTNVPDTKPGNNKEEQEELDLSFSEPITLQDMNEKTNWETLTNELEKEKIFPLKKKSLRFPKARFFCRLCDYHMDTVEDCQKHIKDGRHGRRNEISKFEAQLKIVPPPCPQQIDALDGLMDGIFCDHGLTPDDVEYRKEIARNLQETLCQEESLKDVKLHLYGSSLSTVGLKSSDVNIDLVVPPKFNPAKALTEAHKLMKDMDKYKDVHSDFSSKVPCIYFTEPQTSLTCQLTIGGDIALQTSRLLLMYVKCDPRLQKLGVVVRRWAKICKVDRQTEGTLPAFCYILMTVYFLQQCSPPVLPILKTFEDDKTQNKKTPAPKCLDQEKVQEQVSQWKSQNTESIGCLWLKLLKFYSTTFENGVNIVCIRQKEILSRAEKKWNTKRLAVEDPFSTKRNAARACKSYEIFEYIWDCIRISYLYFGLPTNFKLLSEEEQNEYIEPSNQKKSKKNRNACAQQTSYVGKSPVTHTKVSSDLLTKTSSEGNGALNDETFQNDPSPSEKSDVLLNGLPSSSFCKNCKESISTGCIDPGAKTTNRTFSSKESDSSESLMTSDSVESVARSIVQGVIQNAYLTVFSHLPALYNTTGHQNKACVTNSSSTVHLQEVVDVENETLSSESSEDEPLITEYKYEFSGETMSDGKGPAIFCVLCEKEGHLKMSCPEETIPEISPLPPMTKDHLKKLTDVLKQVPKDFAPSKEEYSKRECIRQELECFIQELYPRSRLHLFGSSHNGFGFRHSDLDLCVTFDDEPTPENVDFVECILSLTKKLKTHRGLYNVFPITTAKVPIVKFRHRQSQLEGDISLYNLLAQHNTNMIRLYSLLDNRVKVLGYSFKVFAKICDIGDASRGSLSSYAYILMLIYYLQQCKPPVLPVLQELYTGPNKPEVIVDGWNAWYYDDVQNLSKVWPYNGKNNLSVGELWTGLFKFYTESFNMSDYVICIRQHEPLTRFEKLWNGRCVAIEDPFDLNHNLGGALSRKMHQFIIKAFIQGRRLYCTPLKELPPNMLSLADYFFDKTQLTDGNPPNDRCCRVCNKIGHIAKECPVVLNRKEREEKERKRKEDMETRRKEEEKRKQEYLNQREHTPDRMYRRSLSEAQDYDRNANMSPNNQQYKSHTSTTRQHSYPPGNKLPFYPPQSSFHMPYPQMQQQQHSYLGMSPPKPHGIQITGPPPQQLSRQPMSMPRNHDPRMQNRNPDPRMHQHKNFASSTQVSSTNNVSHEHPWIQQHMSRQHPTGTLTDNSNTKVDESSNPPLVYTTNIHNPSLVMGMPLVSCPLYSIPSQQVSPLIQGIYPAYQQSGTSVQVSSAGRDQGRLITHRNQTDFGITVQNELYRGNHDKYIPPHARGSSQQQNRASPKR